MKVKQKSGFTRTGFSKKGFGACGHWNKCQLGKLECFYADTDPEVKEYCDCYKRNHENSSMKVTGSRPIINHSPVLNEEKEENSERTSMAQLSLF